VQVAARNTAEGDLWLTNQSGKGSSVFNAAQDVGGAGAQQPAIGKLPDGNLVTFAIVNGSMWHLPQDGVTMPYGAWRQVGGANLVGEPTVVTIRDGLRLFALTTTGAVQTATYRNGLLSDWTGLGAEQFTGRIAAAVLPGYRSRVVVRNADGLLFTKGENLDGTFEATWTQIGDFAAAGSPAAVMDPATGATAVVARGAGGQVYYVSETAQATGVWGTWRVAFERVVETDPTIITYTKTGGPAWGYLTRDVNNVPSLYELRRGAVAARGTAAAEPAFVAHTLPAPPK
jgi:hypothetical protein